MSSQSEDEETICQKKGRLLRAKSESKRVKVVILNEIRKRVQPIINDMYQFQNGKNKFLYLQEYWTKLFVDVFGEEHEIPCTYVVNKHNISTTKSVYFLVFNGQHKVFKCKVTFFGEIDNEHIIVGKDVSIVFFTRNQSGVDHLDVKKPLFCFIDADHLISGPFQRKRKVTDKNMEFGDAQGHLMCGKNVLKKPKLDITDGDSGTSRRDLLTCLTDLKHGAEHKGSIHTIRFDKFFLHYWSPIQDHLYKATAENSWMTLIVDATGSLVTPITRTENHMPSGHILLYQMAMSIGGQTVPVAQQLSEKQDMPSICCWMANWAAPGMKPPNECVTDYSSALLGAITSVFCNRMTVNEYIETCFSFLLNKSTALPQCFVRVDAAHIIHTISRWKCFKGRRRLKHFYLRCIAQLIQNKILNEFEGTLQNIIIIATAEFDGDNVNGQPTPAKYARQYLQNLILGSDIPVQANENEDQTNYKGITTADQFYCEPEVNARPDENMCVIDWIYDILQVASREASVHGDRLNEYYCLDLINPLLRLCSEYPLWSAVMVDAFNSPNEVASSIRVKDYFKDIKSSIIEKKTPRMRVDDFIVTHLRAIRDAANLAKCDMDIKNQSVKYFNAGDRDNTEELENNTEQVGNSFDSIKTAMNLDCIKSGIEQINNENSTIKSFENEGKPKMSDGNSMNALYNNYSDNLYTQSECNERFNQNNSVYENKEDNVNSNTSNSIYPRETTYIPGVTEDLESDNWRNKIDNRLLNVEKRPERKAEMQANSQCKKKIDVIRNGNCLGPVTVKDKTKSKKYILLNTCPFDAITQGIAIAYTDSNSYAEYLCCSNNLLVQLAITLVEKGAILEIYQKRAELLAPICKLKILIDGVIELDARYNVNYLIETLLASEPSIIQYHICANNKCRQNVIPKQFYPLNLGEILKGSFSNLQTAIDNMIPSPLHQFERKCYRDGCNGKITVTKSLMPHVWFDTILNIVGETTQMKCRLSDIPNEIKIKKTSFRLVAVIDFNENKTSCIAHYVTHVIRTSGFWETYNDLTSTILKCKYNKKVTPHVLYYIRFN